MIFFTNLNLCLFLLHILSLFLNLLNFNFLSYLLNFVFSTFIGYIETHNLFSTLNGQFCLGEGWGQEWVGSKVNLQAQRKFSQLLGQFGFHAFCLGLGALQTVDHGLEILILFCICWFMALSFWRSWREFGLEHEVGSRFCLGNGVLGGSFWILPL